MGCGQEQPDLEGRACGGARQPRGPRARRARSLWVLPSSFRTPGCGTRQSLSLFRSSSPNLLIYSIRTGRERRCNEAAGGLERGGGGSLRLGGRARGFVSAARTSGGSNLRDEDGDQKGIEAGRAEKERKARWALLAPAGAPPTLSRRQPAEESSHRVGAGAGRCVCGQIGK